MAIEKIVNVVFNEVGADQVISDAERLNTSLEHIEGSNSGVTGSFKESTNSILENGGAMGLLNDLTGGYAMTVKDAVEAAGLFGKGTSINTGLQKIYSLAVGQSTGAMKAFRLALISTGIGAFIVALGFLIEYMSDATEATEEEKKAQDALGESIKKTTQNYKQLAKELDSYTTAAKLRAEIAGASAKDLLNIEIEASEERRKLLLEEEKSLMRKRDTENVSLEQSKEINDRLLEINRERIDELNKQEILRLQFQKDVADEQREAEKAANDKRIEEIKKRNEERLAAEKEFRKQLLAELEAFNAAVFEAEQRQGEIANESEQAKNDLLKSIRGEQRLTELQEELENGRRILESAKASIDERLEYETAMLDRRREIEAEYQLSRIENLTTAAQNEELDFESRREILDYQNQLILESTAITEQEKTNLLAQNAEARKAILWAEVDAYASQGKAIAGLLNQASELAGKNTSKGKFLAAASATISTLLSAVDAYKGMVSAIPGPVGIAAGAVAAAFSLASGFASVKKIYAVPVPGGGGGGGGGSPGAAPAPPSFNIVGQSSTNQLAQSINAQTQQQQQPTRAYVVGSEVTTQQAMDRQIQNTATFT